MKFSDPDRAVLRLIQQDGAAALAEVGQRVGMATSTVWRKLQDLEAAGVIRRRVALLNAKLVGAGLCVFATVRLSDHSEGALRHFAQITVAHPEIMEAHAITGTADYMLKIRCADVEAYEVFMSGVLLRATCVKSVQSSFSLRELKYTTELPL